MIKRFLLFLIKIYRKFISPLKGGSTCRYYPTCSSYALQAIEKYGSLKGTFLSVRRIIKCNPFFSGGVDPVP